MDAEFADLIPLFVEEARDRLERLATCVPRLEVDPQCVVEAKRELHTLKGAGRMMRIGARVGGGDSRHGVLYSSISIWPLHDNSSTVSWLKLTAA